MDPTTDCTLYIGVIGFGFTARLLNSLIGVVRVGEFQQAFNHKSSKRLKDIHHVHELDRGEERFFIINEQFAGLNRQLQSSDFILIEPILS